MGVFEYIYNIVFVLLYTLALCDCFYSYGAARRPIFARFGLLLIVFVIESLCAAVFSVFDESGNLLRTYFILGVCFTGIDQFLLGEIVNCFLQAKRNAVQFLVPTLSMLASVAAAVLSPENGMICGDIFYAAGCIVFCAEYAVQSRSGDKARAAEDVQQVRRLFLLLAIFNGLEIFESALCFGETLDAVQGRLTGYMVYFNIFGDLASLVYVVWMLFYGRKVRARLAAEKMESMLQQRMNEWLASEMEKQQQTTNSQLEAFCASYALTPREQEILRLLLDGKSNRELAQELFITEGTVKAHLHSIYGKLNVTRRSQLMNRFFSQSRGKGA